MERLLACGWGLLGDCEGASDKPPAEAMCWKLAAGGVSAAGAPLPCTPSMCRNQGCDGWS